jgi:hypothetical protein
MDTVTLIMITLLICLILVIVGAAYLAYSWMKEGEDLATIIKEDAKMIAPPEDQIPSVIHKERVVEREIVVRIKCQYCGTLNDQTAKTCESCGAKM